MHQLVPHYPTGMRIIAGDRKGFPLIVPEGQHTRPTLSRIREAMFSIVADVVPDALVWDIYAGAGTLGLEALSRGARQCRFVENNPQALESLSRNIQKLKFESEARVERMHAIRWIERAIALQPFTSPDLILADPPYTQAPELILNTLTHTTGFDGTILVLQMSSKVEAPDRTDNWELIQRKKYGATTLQIYRGTASNQEAVPTDNSETI